MTNDADPLAYRFAALANGDDDSDWVDVRRRARAPSRRWAVIAIAAAFALIAMGSAFALYREFVDFSSAEPAPERIQLDFNRMRKASLDAQARGAGGPGWRPVGAAREVLA